MSYILNIYTNPATDYIIDPEPVANLVAKQVAFSDASLLPASLSLQSKTSPQVPGEPISHKTKKSQISLRLDFERKTRLELETPTLARLCSTN